MKKRIIIIAFLPLLFCFSCSKERTCRCVTTETDPQQETFINADRGMKCSKITRLGYERQSEGHLIRTYEPVECEDFSE